MRLVCDSCGAKYSIGDDRVAGKVFKVRCKKCSFVMMVRDHVRAPAASGEWHAVIDGEQRGPFERAELVRRRDAGELGSEALVWREGMADWAALSSVEELGASRKAEESLPRPPASDEPKLRGERNETSVLFTLHNLTQLAAPKVEAVATKGPHEEGSGLIDIRAIASTLAPTKPARAVSASALDDIPTYGPVGFADPIVLVPQGRGSGRPRELIYALVGVIALLLAVSIVMIVVLLRDESAAPVAGPTTPAPTPIAEPPTPPPIATTPPAPEPPPPQVALDPRKAAPPPVKTQRSKPPAPKVATPPAAPPTPECSEVSCIVNNYAGNCCDAYKPRAEKRETKIDLPDSLDKAAVAAGLGTIKAQACGNRSAAKGDVHVSIKVSPDGDVANVTITSSPDDTLSSCVVAAAQKGSFAKSKRGGSFKYVWRF